MRKCGAAVCGEDESNDFLKTKALRHIKAGVSRTMVLPGRETEGNSNQTKYTTRICVSPVRDLFRKRGTAYTSNRLRYSFRIVAYEPVAENWTTCEAVRD